MDPETSLKKKKKILAIFPLFLRLKRKIDSLCYFREGHNVIFDRIAFCNRNLGFSSSLEIKIVKPRRKI